MSTLNTPLRVILADDHPIVRSGIRNLIDQCDDITVVGEAGDGTSALEMAYRLKPDVLVMDIEMPGITGVEIARQIQRDGSAIRLLALSAHDDEQYIFGLLDAGVAGYLTKNEAPSTILEAVRGVARGEEGWLSRPIMAKVMRRRYSGPASHPVRQISPREKEVLQLLAKGANNEEIAQSLSISLGTVRNHVTNLIAKLEVRSRTEASAWAWQHGIMTP